MLPIAIVTRRIAVMVPIAVMVAIAVMMSPMGAIAVALAAIAIRVMAIAAVLGHAAFAIDPIRRKVAGTAIGRALDGVIILMHRIGVAVVLLHRVGQPLITPGAGACVAAGIDRLGGDIKLRLRARLDIRLSAWRARTLEQSASARHRGHGARSHHGNGRYQS